ncbi:D-tyrosyl-tRNA(Tyr) deacylase [Ptychographa xylographoides]|nr:D-tyrosyl-tRNA(Tyr) deacylase [Ptychographa xylographoides]
MKAVLQRVVSASVTVDKQLISSIDRGILVFAAVERNDTRKEVEAMAAKVLKLKIWPDEAGGTWKRSVLDVKGEVLCVSQFTLAANTKKGNKPDFHGAANPQEARELYDIFFSKVQELYEAEKVKNGVFQAIMEVGLVNDGPVGVVYRCDNEAVTMEITMPPQRKTEDIPQKAAESGVSSTTFEMPASLLE